MVPFPLPTNTCTTSKQLSCVQGPLRECCSILSGHYGLPLYCTPLTCVPDVIGMLAVWWHNKNKEPKIGSAIGVIVYSKQKQKQNLFRVEKHAEDA